MRHARSTRTRRRAHAPIRRPVPPLAGRGPDVVVAVLVGRRSRRVGVRRRASTTSAGRRPGRDLPRRRGLTRRRGPAPAAADLPGCASTSSARSSRSRSATASRPPASTTLARSSTGCGATLPSPSPTPSPSGDAHSHGHPARPARDERRDLRAPHPARRRTELRLLIFAVLVAMLAYASVALAHDERLASGVLGYGGESRAALRAPRIWRCDGSHRTPTRCCCRSPPLLNGVGLVVVRRLDLAASDRARNSAAGCRTRSPAAAGLDRGRRRRCSSPCCSSCATTGRSTATATRWPRRPRAAAAPGAARHRPHHQRRAALDPGRAGLRSSRRRSPSCA